MERWGGCQDGFPTIVHLGPPLGLGFPSKYEQRKVAEVPILRRAGGLRLVRIHRGIASSEEKGVRGTPCKDPGSLTEPADVV